MTLLMSTTGCFVVVEFKTKNIAVGILHPGFNRTEMTKKYEHIWDEEGAVQPTEGETNTSIILLHPRKHFLLNLIKHIFLDFFFSHLRCKACLARSEQVDIGDQWTIHQLWRWPSNSMVKTCCVALHDGCKKNKRREPVVTQYSLYTLKRLFRKRYICVCRFYWFIVLRFGFYYYYIYLFLIAFHICEWVCSQCYCNMVLCCMCAAITKKSVFVFDLGY